MKYSLGKVEKLKSNRLIEALFLNGSRINSFPLQLLFLQTSHQSSFPIQVGFSVPKRNVKLAVKRNRIKRLMREVYRKNKYLFFENLQNEYIFMFIYTSNKEMTYDEMEMSLKNMIVKFKTKLLSGTSNSN